MRKTDDGDFNIHTNAFKQINQPTNQPTNQPINQPNKQTNKKQYNAVFLEFAMGRKAPIRNLQDKTGTYEKMCKKPFFIKICNQTELKCMHKYIA
jgi:hypothetical protein